MKKLKESRLLSLFFIVVLVVNLAACGNGKTEPSSGNISKSESEGLEEESEEPELHGLKGLITIDISNEKIVVSVIDEDTGEKNLVSTFPHSGNSSYKYKVSELFNDPKSYFTRQVFSNNYKKCAFTFQADDGSHHVGWHDENGTFFDVTEKISGDSTDFSYEKPFHYNPLFGNDNFFYFSDKEGIKRVPISNIGEKSVEIIEERDGSDKFALSENGQPLKDDNNVVESSSGNYWAGVYSIAGTSSSNKNSFNDWVDDSHFIGIASDNEVYLYEAYSKEDDYDNIHGYATADTINHSGKNKVKKILPENARKNSSYTISPDGKQMAFISRNGEAGTEIYICNIENGDTKPITSIDESGQVFFSRIIDWL